MRATVALMKSHARLLKIASKTTFWFSMGVAIGLFLLISFGFLIFQLLFAHVVYPGVSVENIPLGGKTQAEVAAYFAKRNAAIAATTFTFTSSGSIATASAQRLHLGFNGNLLAEQAISIGRSS